MKKQNYILFCLLICWNLLLGQSWMEGMHTFNLNIELAQKRIDSIKVSNKSIKGTGIKVFERWKFDNRYHLNQENYIESKQNAIREYKLYKKENSSNNRSALPQWWPLGPFDWSAKPETSANNPGMGRINAVRIAPSDNNIIFVATASGGIWKSEDGGLHWNTNTDTLGIMAFSDIAIHPTNPDVVYAASGDRDGLDVYGMGVYKSIDGGLSWQQTTLGRNKNSYNYIINRLLIDDKNPDKIIACSPRGIHVSQNAGVNWEDTYSSSGTGAIGISGGPNMMNLIYHPTDHNIIYAAGTDFLISRDGGQTWRSEEEGLPTNMGRCEVAVSMDDPDRVYVISTNSSYAYTGIYRSDNKGVNFDLVSDPSVNVLGYSLTGEDDRSQAFYDLALAVNPENADELFSAGINIWKSIDGGVTMTNMSDWHWNGQQNYHHADVHQLHFDQGRFWCASDGGVFVSNDLGQSWQDLSHGLVISQFYALELDQKNNRILAGSQDNAFSYYSNEKHESIWEGDGFVCKFHPEDTSTFYVATQYGHIWKTQNNGDVFDYAYPEEKNGQWQTPYQMSNLNPDVLWVGYDEIYITQDGAQTWQKLTNFNNSGNFEVLEVAFSDENYIYASKGSVLYKSFDAGQNWEQVQLYGRISSIAIHPKDPERIYVTFASNRSNKVNVSFDAGENFINISDSLPNLDAYYVVYEPNRNGRLYLGMEMGLYYYDSTMFGWRPFMNGLPDVRVTQIKLDTQNRIMRAALYGRGLWQAHLDGNVGIEDRAQIQKNALLSVYPNQVQNNAIVEYNQANCENISLVLWGMNGQQIQSTLLSNRENKWSLNLDGLASGTYFVSALSSQKVLETIKLVKQ